MEDDAYYSGNLQAEAVPGEPSREITHSDVPKLDSGLGDQDPAVSEKGTKPEQTRIPDLQSQLRSAKPAAAKATADQRETIVPRSAKSVVTPTTHLVNRMDKIGLAMAGQASLEGERYDSGFDSGIFPSLPESELASLPEKPSPEEKESDMDTTNKMDTSTATADPVPKVSEPERQQTELPGVRGRGRSESPSVPPVAESVEVVTELLMMRPEGSTPKRSAGGSPLQEYGAKSPRLGDAVPASFAYQRAIQVPTIMFVGPKPSPHAHREGGRSPERVESKSPVAMTALGEKCDVQAEKSAPRTATKSSISGFSISQILDDRHTERPPLIVSQTYGEGEEMTDTLSKPVFTRHSETPAFTGHRSPRPPDSPLSTTSPMAVEKLISPKVPRHRSTSPVGVSRSPHSPRSPQGARGDKDGKNKDPERETSKGYHSTPAEDGGTDKEKEGQSGAQKALLQVSEAHLAILPDEDGDTPLHLAIVHEKFDLVKHLIQLIVGVYLNLDIANNMRQTPLHLSVITRQPRMVQLLVSGGASVNFPDRKGNTSIHLASQRRDVRVLQLLSQATSPLPDFNCMNFAGLTAVHVATKEASIDVLKYLFQMGANKNATDACSGRTALHYAVEQENFILVNFLLENSCNVNATTFAGNTPLHIAAGRRLKEIVALLMAYGANPAIANGEGDFPTDLPASLLMQRAKMNAH